MANWKDKQRGGFFAMIHAAGCPRPRAERLEWINRWREERGYSLIKSTNELDPAAKSEMQRELDTNKNKEW